MTRGEIRRSLRRNHPTDFAAEEAIRLFGRRSSAEDTARDRPQFDLRAAVADDVLFRRFYEETAPRVYAFLYSRTGSVTTAEELTQETFVEIVRNPAKYDGRLDPVPWMIGVARHRLLRHVRATRQADERAREVVREINPIAGDSSRALETHDLVESALRGLTLEQRTALLLRFSEDMTVRDVAKAIGRSENATESLLRRARASFEVAYRGAPQ
jgi:RNA polymerase sigma-70 factor, ECF subfamily